MADLRREIQGFKDKLDRRAQQGPSEEMRVTRLHAPGVDVDDLARRLVSFLESKKLEAQILEGGATRTVQARTATWRKAVGMSSAITVVLRLEGEDLAVEIGRAKWGDKAAAGAAGMLVLWPLAITAAVGAFREGQLPKETLRFISGSLGTGPSRSTGIASSSAPTATPSEYTPASRDARFDRGDPLRDPAPPRETAQRFATGTDPGLDANVATIEQLAAVPGLDRLSASRIVEQRNRAGGFADMGELAQATRLPPHVVVRASEHLTFGGTQSRPPSGRRMDW
jgi:hypothetical protein